MQMAGNNVKENTKKQAASRFEFKKKNDDGMKERNISGKGKEKVNEGSINHEEMMNEEDLVPSIKERETLDMVINMKKNMSDVDMEKWTSHMKRYYRDRNELINAADEMKMEEDVVDTHNNEENNVVKNVVEGIREIS
nr:hypothetical protein [Tanacetum cinerariifolium]